MMRDIESHHETHFIRAREKRMERGKMEKGKTGNALPTDAQQLNKE